MTQEKPKTRSQVHEIEIEAPAEAVWKALTDAEELTRWFVESAQVTPGKGGTIRVSWGEGQAGEGRIDVWEPPTRLRTILQPFDAESVPGTNYDSATAQRFPIFEEYTIESRGARTLLRLVHSGIPDVPEWDDFYNSTNQGWEMFFRALRHYLEKHPGKPRHTILIMEPIKTGLEQAWQKLTGPEGLAAKGSLSGLSEGSRYSTVTSAGRQLDGEIVMALPPKVIAMTIENLDNALFCATIESMGETTFTYMTLATYGLDPAKNEEIRNQWTGWLRELLS